MLRTHLVQRHVQEVGEVREEEWRQKNHIGHIVKNIRHMARKAGMNPDDIIQVVRPGFYAPGPALLAMDLPPLPPEVGARYRPKDMRRVKPFTVTKVEGDVVHGSDGRTVQVDRLLARYDRL